MSKKYIQPGETMTFTAPGGGVVSGGGYKIGQLFVVAVADAAAGAQFAGVACGVHELPKTTGEAWAEGALIYWSTGAGEANTTALGDLLIGCAAAAAASADAVGKVRLNGTARPQEP